jgi:transcriptional regulator with XRE-family HTH domain
MPLIPKLVVDRIASGENALRALREWRGKTQLDIAHKTKIGQGYISDLADGEKELPQL